MERLTMKIYGIFHEDGSMDDGGFLMENHIYVKKEDAEVVRHQLYDSDLSERRKDFRRSDPSYLGTKLEEEIKMGREGNLNPLYEIHEIEVHED